MASEYLYMTNRAVATNFKLLVMSRSLDNRHFIGIGQLEFASSLILFYSKGLFSRGALKQGFQFIPTPFMLDQDTAQGPLNLMPPPTPKLTYSNEDT